MTPESRDFRARMRESAPFHPPIRVDAAHAQRSRNLVTSCGAGRGAFNPREEGRVWEPGELPVARVERRLFWRSVGRWCRSVAFLAFLIAFFAGLIFVCRAFMAPMEGM